jgi:hypothetical protein
VVGLVCAVALAACGGRSTHSTTTSTISSTQADQLFVDYVHCVRARGVPISDPAHRPGHQGLSLMLPDAGTPGLAAADAACRHFLAPVIAMKAGSQARPNSGTMNALIAYVRCMRRHDIPLLDPDPNDGHIATGEVAGLSNVSRGDPQFRNADTQCRSMLPPHVPDDGTGPP